MKLLRLSVTNFATYEKEELNLEKLIYPVFVEGNTGAGKTTLFVDGVTMALYGLAYGERQQKYAREAVMKEKSQATIELEFEVKGERYKILRIIYGKNIDKTQEAKLYKWDPNSGKYKLLATSKKVVDNKIKSLLGIGFEALLLSAIVRQGDVYKFLDYKPSDRREFLMELLKLKVFNTYREKAKEFRKEKEKHKTIIETQIKQITEFINQLPKLEEELKSINSKLPVLEGKKSEIETNISTLKSKIDALRIEIMKLSKKIGELEEKQRSLSELEKKEKDLEQKIKTLEKMLKDVDVDSIDKALDIDVKIVEAEKLREKISHLENEIRRAKKIMDKIKEKDRLLQRIENIKSTIGDLEQLKTQKDEIMKKIAVNKNKIRETENHLKELLKGVGRCPVCGAILTEERKKQREIELRSEIENLKKEIAELTQEKLKLDETIRGKEKRKSELDSLIGRLRGLEADLRREKLTEEDLKKLQEEKDETMKKFSEILEAIELVAKTRDLREAKKFIAKIKSLKRQIEMKKEFEGKLLDTKNEIIKLRDELKELEPTNKLYNEKTREFNDLKKKLETLETEYKEILQEISQLNGAKAKIEERIEDIKAKQKEIEEKKKKLGELVIDIDALKILEDKVFHPSTLPTKLLQDFLKKIEEYANEYLRVFGQDITLRLFLETRGADKERIELKLYHHNYERDIKTFSGGERTLIGFAIRLAIGRLLTEIQPTESKPRFLIIDEGFGPLDEELRVKVAEALTSLMNVGEYEQIIMISHQAELKDSPIFQTVLKVEKHNNRSKIIPETLHI